MHRQGLQRAAQRGCAPGIDDYGPRHDYMRALAHRCGAHLALRVLMRGPDPGFILAAGAAGYDELFHGSNAIGVERPTVRVCPKPN